VTACRDASTLSLFVGRPTRVSRVSESIGFVKLLQPSKRCFAKVTVEIRHL